MHYRPKAAVHASSRRCGATSPKRTFEQVRSILLRSMTAMRTKRPVARAAIADAAFVRSCGNFYTAMQPASWKRPFKATISVGFKPTFRRVMFEFTDRGTLLPFVEGLVWMALA
jgi:hypothetical protein